MKKIFYTSLFIFAVLSRSWSQDNCSLKKDRDGIKVYTCHNDTSRFKSIIAEFTINSSFNELITVVMNIPEYTQWQFNTIEANVIKEISSSEQIYRTVIEAPWPVVDRDMVTHIRVSFDDNKKEASITTESVSGIIPPTEKYVRVPSSHAHWSITQRSERQLQIRYTMQIDPGGSVPAWLANWVCAQAPYESFKNLKTILEKKK